MAKSFALGDRFERFIVKQVKGGRFNNASEVVRAGLRLLEDDERRRFSKASEIRALIAEADSDDARIPLKQAFDSLEKRFRKTASADTKRKK